MAKSYIQWDSPVLNDLDSVSNVNDFLSDFDTKMQEAGLNKIANESTEFVIPTTPWASPTAGQFFEVMKLAYSFPKGKNKVEYEDVSGQTYKKIKRASFSNTDTQILFKVFYFKATSSNGLYPWQAYYTDSTMLIFELWTRNTNGGVWNKISTMGSKYIYGSGDNLTKGIEQVSRTNYIIQTEDTFAIYFGYVKYTFSPSPSNGFNNPNCLVSFILKRDDSVNGHSFVISGDSRIDVTNPVSNKLYLCSYHNNGAVIDIFDENTNNFFNVNFSQASENIDGNTVLYPVIMKVKGSKSLNEAVYTTRYLPDTPLLTDNNVIINYKNKNVIVGTVDFGKYNITLTYSYSSSLRYGFSMIKTDFDIITGDLT